MKIWSPLRQMGLVGVACAGVLLFAAGGCDKPSSDEEATAPANGRKESASHKHATAGETCFICDPRKRDPGRLWCSEHGRYENRCWLCQPQLEDKSRAYCKEHFLYEDECFLCRPELKTDADKPSDSDSKKSPSSRIAPQAAADLFCREHRVPEIECGICQPQRTKELEAGEELKVRFESRLAAAKAGIQTALATEAQVQAGVSAICEVRYNENRLARITPLAPGIVRRVLMDVGSEVKAGELLVEIHSAEVASTKTAFVSAVVDANLKEVAYKREERLVKKKISSEKELQEADAARKTAKLAVNTARQRLLNLGFTQSEISAIEETQDGSARLLVRAPYDGTLVDRAAVVGEAVEPGDALFTLADLSTMWLALSIPADIAHLVQNGLEVEATLGGDAGIQARGRLTWIHTSIDEKSRMVRARAVVSNPERKLRSGMFGEARALLAGKKKALTVPKGAIQRYERRPYVFVKLEEDLYALRRVVVERYSERTVAVVAGLRPEEPVVVNGAFTVMSEFLKSRLGAGCVDE